MMKLKRNDELIPKRLKKLREEKAGPKHRPARPSAQGAVPGSSGNSVSVRQVTRPLSPLPIFST